VGGHRLSDTAHRQEELIPHVFSDCHLSCKVSSGEGGDVPHFEIEVSGLMQVKHSQHVDSDGKSANADNAETLAALESENVIFLKTKILNVNTRANS